jgi:hypothetical protein
MGCVFLVLGLWGLYQDIIGRRTSAAETFVRNISTEFLNRNSRILTSLLCTIAGIAAISMHFHPELERPIMQFFERIRDALRP